MKTIGGLRISLPGECEIEMTREFSAPRQLVFDAHTKCHLIKRWLFGPDGWEMSVCEVDLRVGGKYHYRWRDTAGKKKEFGLGGEFREIAAPERLVMSEKFDDAWYPGEALDIMVLTEQGGKTTLTLTVRYQSRQARDMALKSGFETGMEAGYQRLEKLMATTEFR
jgi:uncharacterized protein YndB with AHSA1/START domain